MTIDSGKLAINGGKAVRETFLPYALHWVGNEEAQAASDVINNKWLTEGETLRKFEEMFASYVGVKHAIAVSSCTTALHLCMVTHVKPGDEVITTPISFVASPNSVLYTGARPVFADIDPDTLNISPESIAEKITGRTKAILPVHYGGLPCEMKEIIKIADENGLAVIDDAAHAAGAEYDAKKIGSIGDATCFSFHPAKQMTTGEGGMITTDDDALAKKITMLRGHGIDKDFKERLSSNSYYYEMKALGYNYRISDINAAIGIEQLKKLENFIKRREDIARIYNKDLSKLPIKLPQLPKNGRHAWHVYTIQLELENIRADRDTVFRALRSENIGVNVLFIPIYKQPYYRGLGYKELKNTESAFERILTIPLFAKMSMDDAKDVVDALSKVLSYYMR